MKNEEFVACPECRRKIIPGFYFDEGDDGYKYVVEGCPRCGRIIWVEPKSRKVKPALYALRDLPWAWVRLGELSEIVDMSSSTVWGNFFFLSKDVDLLAISDGVTIWNVGQRGEVAMSRDRNGELQYAFGSSGKFRSALRDGNVFVPSGWALAVVRARELGAVRVIEREYGHRLFEKLDDDDDDFLPGILLDAYDCPL